MDNQKQDVSRWVEDRLASLEPGRGWKPDSGGALDRLRRRDRERVIQRNRWIWASAAACVTAVALLVLAAPQACATPRACVRSIWASAFDHTPSASGVAETADSPAFKWSGSPSAKVTCEIYSDYECPACAHLYTDVVPMLVTDYVRTGKIRLLHRDFPLAMHAYSKLAARYANAAGIVGQYDLAVSRLFQTQSLWGRSGDVDTQLAQVLVPQDMQKVRDTVANDQHLDDTVSADMAMGAKDHLTQTPTIVIVYNGKRQVLAGEPDYSLLKSYLDQILVQ